MKVGISKINNFMGQTIKNNFGWKTNIILSIITLIDSKAYSKLFLLNDDRQTIKSSNKDISKIELFCLNLIFNGKILSKFRKKL